MPPAVRRFARRVLPISVRSFAVRGLPALAERHDGRDLAQHRATLDRLAIVERDLETAFAGMRANILRLDGLDAAGADLAHAVRTLELQAAIPCTEAWLARTRVPETMVVSVVTPTRNRRDLLEQALASVRAQEYRGYEHIVVDDGSTDTTPALLDAVGDDRVRVLRTGGVGVAAARNVALEVARGDVVAYLDDDNLMHRSWLKAVVWAFSRLPDVDFLYGARIMEDSSARHGRASGDMPRLDFVAYDRRIQERLNIIDTNVIAHRAGIPGARFAAHEDVIEDWEFGLRLTVGRPPLALPAIACTYRTLAAGRLCDAADGDARIRRLRSTVHTLRPMRVLVMAASPGIAVDADVGELIAGEAEVACCLLSGDGALGESVTVYRDINAALRMFCPDLVLVEWSPAVEHQFRRLAAAPFPYAVRAADEAPAALGPRRVAVLTPREHHSEPPSEALAVRLSAALAAFRLESPL